MKKTFILVHGAWHGGWCWAGVADYLGGFEHRTVSPTMPGHAPGEKRSGIGLADYVTALIDAIDRETGSLVLVGHSSGGFLIQCAAAKRPDRVSHLVFVNAFILDHGKSQFDMIPKPVSEGMTAAAAASDDNTIPVMADFIRTTLMSGDSREDQDRLISRLVPQPLTLFNTPMDLAGFDPGRFALSLVHCTKDRSLPPGAYADMAAGIGCTSRVDLDLDHEGLFTHPGQVGEGILAAVAGARTPDNHHHTE